MGGCGHLLVSGSGMGCGEDWTLSADEFPQGWDLEFGPEERGVCPFLLSLLTVRTPVLMLGLPPWFTVVP